MSAGDDSDDKAFRRRQIVLRLLAFAVVGLAVAVVWYTHQFLTQRFTEATRNRAEVRLALYTGNLMSELQRNSVVPLLLARDPALTGALERGDYSVTSQRLISLQGELGTASMLLLDAEGRTVAATDRNRLGTSHRNQPYYVEAQRGKETIFTSGRRESGGFRFTFSRALMAEGRSRGVIVVEVDLMKYERSWAGLTDAVAVMDSEGIVVLATEPRWRGLPLDQALELRDPPTAIGRALKATADWAQTAPDAYVRGEAVMRTDARVPFRGWRMVVFSRYDSVRERVNAFLAMEIMGFALLMAAGFWLTSRQAQSQSRAFQRESAELRLLNARLQREIAERQRMQENLAVAEQTLAQSSKLAVLGEMSAAVSHELNQPLAAMKTYLAGARLLLQRRKAEEALSSFQRIDDLIDRMGAITRQLKSYARKGGEAFAPVDFKACIGEALSMMEPQLKPRRVRISRALPRAPVMVLADRIRLEQVIINLLRNALDATRDVAEPRIDLALSLGESAVLTVTDNGPGISDLDKLFEPFWTTKKPGEGIGLGLAISSGIASDLGGRLTARNGEEGGAVFELSLPLLDKAAQAAE
ncbi:MAG: ATP-binding protein [Gemmobacter sp.]|uniref:sensor histidine kinase n=1 Tax=Gemmobacter sp. TaxID=1898957 RepID=UPI00391D4CE4